MATCPRCLGPLTEHHKCPHGTFKRLTDALRVVGIGGVVGGLSVWIVDDSPVPALVMAGAALGAVLAVAVRDALGRKS